MWFSGIVVLFFFFVLPLQVFAKSHVDPWKIGVGIFKSMVLETYWELPNETGTKWKLCVPSFRFYERFRVLWPLNNTLFTKCVWLYSKMSTKSLMIQMSQTPRAQVHTSDMQCCPGNLYHLSEHLQSTSGPIFSSIGTIMQFPRSENRVAFFRL